MSLFKNITSVSLFLFHEWLYRQWNIVNFSDLHIYKTIIVRSRLKIWSKTNKIILNFRLKNFVQSVDFFFDTVEELGNFEFCSYVCKTSWFKDLEDMFVFIAFFISLGILFLKIRSRLY